MEEDNNNNTSNNTNNMNQVGIPLLERVSSVEFFAQEKSEVTTTLHHLSNFVVDSIQQQFPNYLVSQALRDKVNDHSKQVAELLHGSLSLLHKTDLQKENQISAKRFVDENTFPFYFSFLLTSFNLIEELSFHPEIRTSAAVQTSAKTLLTNLFNFLQKFEVPPHGQVSESAIPPDEIVSNIKGVSSQKRDSLTEIYRFLKRRYLGIKPSRKQKSRDGVGSESVLKIMNILEDTYPNCKKTKRSFTDDKLFDLLAKQNSQSLENQRFVMSEKKEMKMALNDVIRAVDKLGEGRMHDQSAVSTKMGKIEKAEQVDKIMELVAKSSTQFDDQRYVLSKEKIQKLSLNELVNSVEKLASQRMENQDAISPEEKKRKMMEVIVDVVEKMRASSMDDQRFIERVAPKVRMTPKELNKSIDSFQSTDTAALLGN